MEESIKNRMEMQLRHIKEYIESLIDMNNKIAMKYSRDVMSKPNDIFWGELEKWTELFLNIAELVTREDSMVDRSDMRAFLKEFWELGLYVPDSYNLVHEKLPTDRIDAGMVTVPEWMKYVTTRYEEGGWHMYITIYEGDLILNLIKDKKLIVADILLHGTINVGPFALATYLLTDDDWRKILQIIKNASTG
ncbi:MAG: hypothetical protein JHC26_01940 [Thermofilum sp.]|jgi:hypothetical protein|uniref:hypothetical protein n=1 Tax=Thermofilum sp. TaxID=1961369 RepID=UPI002582D388|nr:hypothetical protein [Thermofilum sp.]MCI4407824.1 hypothetical protein [Thermofilum sp.]